MKKMWPLMLCISLSLQAANDKASKRSTYEGRCAKDHSISSEDQVACSRKFEKCSHDDLDNMIKDLYVAFDGHKWAQERCNIIGLVCIGAYKNKEKEMFHILKLATINHDHELARFLLAKGANVKWLDSLGLSVLYYDIACNVAESSLTASLLEAGTDAVQRDFGGRNALHHLAFECAHYANSEIILEKARMFINAGVGIDQVDYEGENALELARTSRARYYWKGRQKLKACDALIAFLEKCEQGRVQK